MKITPTMVCFVELCGTQFIRANNGKLWIELDVDTESDYTFASECSDREYIEMRYQKTLANKD